MANISLLVEKVSTDGIWKQNAALKLQLQDRLGADYKISKYTYYQIEKKYIKLLKNI